MAVTLDVGTEFQIHSPYKKEVGQRLAFLALAKTYGKTGFECESPEYDRMEVKEIKQLFIFPNSLWDLLAMGSN